MRSVKKAVPVAEVKRPVGRPRSESARTAILRAAYGYLKKRPIGSISTLQIARKAGVSTATVYRWWRSKEALLLEAFRERTAHDQVFEFEGTPIDSIRAHLLQSGRFFMGDSGILVARLLSAIQDNAQLRKAFMEMLRQPRERELRALVQEAIHQKQLPARLEVETFLDALIGPLFARLLLGQESIDEDFVQKIFAMAVAGASSLCAPR